MFMRRTLNRFAAMPLGRSLRGLALAALVLGACGAPQDQARVAEIQREADRRVEAIRIESEKRAAEAQRQMEKLKADLAAKTEELERAHGGRPHADTTDDGFASERRSVEDRGRAALRRLDEEAREIGERSNSLARNTRAEVERALENANGSRKSVENDLDELDRATRQTLRTLSERLERHLAELDQTLKDARKRLK
jgi:hypothetical protein